MTKKLRVLCVGITLTFGVYGITNYVISKKDANTQLTIEEQRAAHAEILANSPFKETLTWDKKKRKLEGLPPNRYFEQMWELTVNPSTGRLEEGNVALLREQLINNRIAQRNPGEATNSWEERGPNDIGGRTRAILFDPNDGSNNTLYAGGVSGGLWRNTNITNASSQWERVQNVPGNLSVTSITVDPNNSNRWFVGTGEQYTGGDVVGNGVYVTNDGGNSWSAVNIPAAGSATFDFNATNLFLSGLFYVNDVQAWDNNGNTEIFVGVGANVYGDAANPTNWLGLQTAGLYHSADGGTTWNRIESSNLEANTSGSTTFYALPNDFEISADNTLWMGTISNAFGAGGGQVFSSTNGTTWTAAAASPLTDSDRVEIAVSSSNPNRMYALTEGNSSPVHVYSTTNAFGSISNGALPNDADQGINANDFTRGQAFYDLMIEVDPNNDNILYVGGIDLFRSTNGASSWTQISKWSNNPGLSTLPVPLVHADQHAMTFRPGNSNQAVFGNDGGIYYASSLSNASSSGSAIGVRNNNYNVTQYVKAGIGPNGAGTTNVIFTAGAQDNGSQAFRGANAAPGINGSEELSDGDGFFTFVDKDGQYMIATFVANVIYRFNLPWDGRGRRQGGSTTLANDQSRGDFVNQMDFDSDANRLLTNNSNGTQNAILSINVAANSSGSLTNNLLSAEPSAFRASPFENNVWYVGLKNGSMVRLSNVTNTSATFTAITTPFVGSISSIRYGATANDIFVTIHNYGVTSVWSTSNAGASWNNKEGDLPNIPVRDILQNPLNRNEAVLATQLGTWSTSNFNDANPNWSQAFNGMSDVSVTSFDYWAVNGDDNNNQIIASTYGRGVFTGSFTASSVPDNEAPTAPTNLVASNITGTGVDLSWNASTDNVGVSSYDILQDGLVIGNTSSTSFQVSGLTINTSYAFNVVAKDASDNTSSQSNTVNVTTLSTFGCTGGLSTFPYAESFENTLGAWTQDSNDDIDWSINSGTTPSNGTGPSSAIDGSFYLYVEASGNGTGFPNMRAILNSPCIDLTGQTSVSFNFNYHMFGSDDFGTIDLEVSTDNGGSWTSIWNRTGNQGDQWLTENIDLTPYVGGGIQLRFNRVTGGIWQADFAFDNVSIEAQGDDTESPSVPTNLTASNTTETSTDLSWTASTDNVGVLEYDVLQDGVIIATITNTNYQVTGLVGSTNYAFEVRARDAAGNESTNSNTANVTTLDPPDTEAPSIPTNLVANNATQTTVDLSWTASTDNVGVTGYDVLQDGGVIATISGTVFQVTGLTSNTSYAFNVRARDAANNVSANSNTANITTDVFVDGESPSTPSNLTASNTTQTSTDLSWTASTDNVGVVDYNVLQDGVVIATAVGTTYQVTGLTASTSYVFTVIARDAAGNESGASNGANVTTQDPPDTTAPTAPTNLVASDITETTTDLSWSASTDNVGVTGYDVLQDGGVIATIAGTTFQVVGLTQNTSYVFTVRARDAANNVSANSNSINVTTLESVVTGCSGGITAFPYSESFENTLGAWTQSTNDDINWTVDASGTPSNGTGPSSAIDGSFYVYVEASGNGTGFPNMRAILNSPCFDLSNEQAATFSFQYHMFGSDDFGSIDLEISDDDGQTWTSIWNRTGNQGNQWLQESIDLAPYVGGSVQLRFNRLTGGIWQADFAFDDVNVTTGLPDTTAPTTPTNLVASNITQTTVDLSWNASTDNVGVTGYDVLQDGVVLGTVTGTSAQVTGLTANTSYVYVVRAIDGAGNVSANSNTANVTTLENTGPTSVQLLGSFFETGFDGWADGGNDCARVSSSLAPEGAAAIRIRDNSGVASSMTSPTLDLSPYDTVEVRFSFTSNSMETGEDFFLRYNNGSGFSTIETYVSGTDFNRNSTNDAVFNLPASSITLGSNSTFRFQCDASANNDQIFIDAVIITGFVGSASVQNSVVETGRHFGGANENDETLTSNFEGDFKLFPMPAVNYVNVSLGLDIEDEPIDVELNIYDLTGKIVKRLQWASISNPIFEKQIDISELSQGIYMVGVTSANGMQEVQKLIKK